MNGIAVPHARVKTSIALLAGTAIFLVALVGTASAAGPVGKDGQIHACYRVKGKPKGSLRVVPTSARCKRGERKVVWSVAGSSGQAGSTGQAGTGGQSGSSGTNGSSSPNEAALKTEVSSLSLKLEALEGILSGITHSDLAGSMATLNGLDNVKLLGAVDAVGGLTNGQLLDAVDAVPLVADVCDQASALTSQSNLLRTGLNGLTTTLSGSLLGPIFGGVSVPPALTDPLTCPTP